MASQGPARGPALWGNPVSRQRGGVDFLQAQMGMPDKLPFEPLTVHTLVPQLKTDLVHLTVDLLHAPFT